MHITATPKEWVIQLKTSNGPSLRNSELDLQKLTEQITELQQSLSESNIALNQERKKVIHFSNEIDSHKCKLNKKYITFKNSKNKG